MGEWETGAAAGCAAQHTHFDDNSVSHGGVAPEINKHAPSSEAGLVVANVDVCHGQVRREHREAT